MWKFGDSLLLGSGTTASQSPFSDEGMIEQIDVLSYDAPCFFSEGTFSEIFTFSGSLMIPLLQAHFLSPWLIRALGSITECQPGSPGLCRTVSGSEISPYFGVQQYIERKVNVWVREIEKLSKFAETQPHAAYAAFTHGLSSRWNYLLRVTDWEALSSTEILQPLETAIQSLFIPALSGQSHPNKLVRDMLALPARLGGLGLANPVATAEEQQAASQLISAPLIERIICQNHCLADVKLPNVRQRSDIDLKNEPSRKRMRERCKINCQIPSSAVWSFPKRKEHQPG